jgi:acyl-CoA thioesterase-1
MIALLVLVVVVIFVAFALIRLGRPPKNNPKQFLRKSRAAGSTVVACVGASTVQGQLGFNFVDYLSERLGPQNYQFINGGVNGDLAFNVLQRMDEALRCNPKYLIIQVAGNDIMAALDPKAARRYTRVKHLPCTPSIEWYGQNVTKIIDLAKHHGVYKIGLVSALVLGELINSRADLAVREYNKVLARIASDTGACFLDVYNKQIEYLTRNQKEPGLEYTGQSGLVMKSFFLHGVWGFSLDKISKRNGFLLATDYIHQNSTSGKMIGQEIENFLAKHQQHA